jgi:prepilin-type N-terminal cleavage/methylation domain-containing protein
MSKSPARDQAGFTVLEVMVAIAVLTIGVVAVAALAGTMMTTGNRSKYMSLEATLASEKLEDLNHWPANVPQVCVPTANASVGSLTSDVLQTTTCPTGASASIAYYDDVNINFANGTSDCVSSLGGCFDETVASVVSGTTNYTTTYHSPDGTVTTTTNTTAPTNMTFHRRWIVEANSPVNGVRRITVLVVVTNSDISPFNPTFQMSIVRP